MAENSCVLFKAGLLSRETHNKRIDLLAAKGHFFFLWRIVRFMASLMPRKSVFSGASKFTTRKRQLQKTEKNY